VREPRERRGALLPIKPNQTIGRDADVRWDDPRLSRVHAASRWSARRRADAPPVYTSGRLRHQPGIHQRARHPRRDPAARKRRD
jgi:hypothetical protein